MKYLITGYIVLIAIMYLIGSFVEVEINFANWTIQGRQIVSVAWVIITILFVWFYLLGKDE